jgi:hypothetical protein
MHQDYSVAGLSARYQWAPPIIAVDGTDKLGGGPDSCDDGVAVVTAV